MTLRMTIAFMMGGLISGCTDRAPQHFNSQLSLDHAPNQTETTIQPDTLFFALDEPIDSSVKEADTTSFKKKSKKTALVFSESLKEMIQERGLTLISYTPKFTGLGKLLPEKADASYILIQGQDEFNATKIAIVRVKKDQATLEDDDIALVGWQVVSEEDSLLIDSVQKFQLQRPSLLSARYNFNVTNRNDSVFFQRIKR